MTTPAPEPKPKRSRRMILWLVAVPIAILLLALAGANWKTFHLAYAKHLMSSEDPAKQNKGANMVIETHLCRDGMSLEEVRRLLAPAEVTKAGSLRLFTSPPLRGFKVSVKGSDIPVHLRFDDDDKLVEIYYETRSGGLGPLRWPPPPPAPRPPPGAAKRK